MSQYNAIKLDHSNKNPMKPSKTGYNIIQIGAEESLTKETIRLMNQPIKKARIKNGWPKTMKDRVGAVSPSSTSPKEKPRKLGNQSKTKKHDQRENPATNSEGRGTRRDSGHVGVGFWCVDLSPMTDSSASLAADKSLVETNNRTLATPLFPLRFYIEQKINKSKSTDTLGNTQKNSVP